MTKTPMRNTPRRTDYSHRSKPAGTGDSGWIWGRHAVLAAVTNPRRRILDLKVTRNAARDLPEGAPHTVCEPRTIDNDLPAGAVHQGFAARAAALEPEHVNGIVDPTHGALLVLDQITDPHNVGAILRSAAAFGIRAVVMQDRKAPPLFGTVCKSAVGAAERVPHVRVTNIADTLTDFRKAGRFVLGLAGEGETALAEALAGPDGKGYGPGIVLVMGSEEKGLRPRVASTCDLLVRIPMTQAVESLNVSNAAAIALYEAAKWRPARSGAPSPEE